MNTVHLIGATATAMYCVLFIPQARKVWAHRHDPHALEAVSVGSQVLLLINCLLWIAYGVTAGAYWSAASSIVPLPLAVFMLVLLHRAPSREPAD